MNLIQIPSKVIRGLHTTRMEW